MRFTDPRPSTFSIDSESRQVPSMMISNESNLPQTPESLKKNSSIDSQEEKFLRHTIHSDGRRRELETTFESGVMSEP